MDFVKALTYPFEDEDWLKKLIFLYIAIIPILGGIAVEGWAVETSRNVKSGSPKPLASWDDFGGIFSRGLPIFLGTIVYFIPASILLCGAYALPIIMAGAAASSNSDSGSTAAGGIGSIAFFCCGCLGLLALLAAAVVFLGGYVRFLDKPEFGTFMQFGENFALVQANIGDFGMAILFMIGAGLIVSVLSWTVIASLLAIPFLSYFRAHIIGQLAAKIGGGAAVQAAPQV